MEPFDFLEKFFPQAQYLRELRYAAETGYDRQTWTPAGGRRLSMRDIGRSHSNAGSSGDGLQLRQPAALHRHSLRLTTGSRGGRNAEPNRRNSLQQIQEMLESSDIDL